MFVPVRLVLPSLMFVVKVRGPNLEQSTIKFYKIETRVKSYNTFYFQNKVEHLYLASFSSLVYCLKGGQVPLD